MSLVHKTRATFLQDQEHGRTIPIVSLFGTNRFDRSTASFSPISYLFVSLCTLRLEQPQGQCGETSRVKERARGNRVPKDETQLYSVRWNGNHFISPSLRKVVPCQTFHSWSTTARKLLLYFLPSCDPQFLSYSYVLFFLSAFIFWYIYWSSHSEVYIELQEGISTRFPVIFLVIFRRYRFRKLIWFICCFVKNGVLKCSLPWK